MATFLELCQQVARESGTVSGVLPSTVISQQGRLAKIVHWTRTAWVEIQNQRADWLFLKDEFEGATTAGTARYTGASFDLDRWAAWDRTEDTLTAYRESDGPAEEGPLLFLPWNLYRRMYGRGVQQQNKPVHFSISNRGELCLGPIPDDSYVIRGLYRKSPQILEANEDVPDMPARFHDLIAWYALLLLAEHDEAQMHIAVFLRRYRSLLGELERDQLERVEIGEALA